MGKVFPVHVAPPPNSLKDRMCPNADNAQYGFGLCPPKLTQTKRMDASEIISMSRLMDLVTDHGHLSVTGIPKGVRWCISREEPRPAFLVGTKMQPNAVELEWIT